MWDGSIDLAPEHLSIVKMILNNHLHDGSKIWLFGSRATGNAKKFSDIDLLIDIRQPISLPLLTRLISAFDESALPYKVDIADYHAINDAFKINIRHQLIAINFQP
jgi:predicted nucleotidyltransferase